MHRFATIILSGVSLAVLGAGKLQAAISYDQDLASPGGTTPGWYDGTSVNPNGGFTVDSEHGIEIGLRAKIRGSSDVIHSSNSTYYVPTGGPDANHAFWNYEFSVDLAPNGVASGYTISNTNYIFNIRDNSVGFSAGGDPRAYWSDDSFVMPDGTKTINYVNSNPADTGFQNSENPSFPDDPLKHGTGNPGFDQNAVNSYNVSLLVFSTDSGQLLGLDTITIVTPEPAALGLVGLVGLGMMRRRRQ